MVNKGKPSDSDPSRRGFLKGLIGGGFIGSVSTSLVAAQIDRFLHHEPPKQLPPKVLERFLADQLADVQGLASKRTSLWELFRELAGEHAPDILARALVHAEAKRSLAGSHLTPQEVWKSIGAPQERLADFEAVPMCLPVPRVPRNLRRSLNVLIPGPYLTDAVIFHYMGEVLAVPLRVEFSADTFLTIKNSLRGGCPLDLVVCADRNILDTPRSYGVLHLGSALDYILLRPPRSDSRLIVVRQAEGHSAAFGALGRLTEEFEAVRKLSVEPMPASSSFEALSDGASLLAWGPLGTAYILRGAGVPMLDDSSAPLPPVRSHVLVLASEELLRSSEIADYLRAQYQRAVRDLSDEATLSRAVDSLVRVKDFLANVKNHVGRSFWWF